MIRSVPVRSRRDKDLDSHRISNVNSMSEEEQETAVTPSNLPDLCSGKYTNIMMPDGKEGSHPASNLDSVLVSSESSLPLHTYSKMKFVSRQDFNRSWRLQKQGKPPTGEMTNSDAIGNESENVISQSKLHINSFVTRKYGVNRTVIKKQNDSGVDNLVKTCSGKKVIGNAGDIQLSDLNRSSSSMMKVVCPVESRAPNDIPSWGGSNRAGFFNDKFYKTSLQTSFFKQEQKQPIQETAEEALDFHTDTQEREDAINKYVLPVKTEIFEEVIIPKAIATSSNDLGEKNCKNETDIFDQEQTLERKCKMVVEVKEKYEKKQAAIEALLEEINKSTGNVSSSESSTNNNGRVDHIGQENGPFFPSRLEWLAEKCTKRKNCILLQETELSKMTEVVNLIAYLNEKQIKGPYLLVVQPSTLLSWAQKFDYLAPSVVKHVYQGIPSAREEIVEDLQKSVVDVILTTFEFAVKDKSIFTEVLWTYIIVDGIQQIKNGKKMLTKLLSSTFDAIHRLILIKSKESLPSKMSELWSIFRYLNPRFCQGSSFEKLLNDTHNKNGAQNIRLNKVDNSNVVKHLRSILISICLPKPSNDVDLELPLQSENIIYCEMSALQKVLYINMELKGDLLTKHENRTDGFKINRQCISQLKKISNHPFLFHEIEKEFTDYFHQHRYEMTLEDLYRTSGKFEVLNRVLPKLLETKRRILIVCYLQELVLLVDHFLNKTGLQHFTFCGREKPEEKYRKVELFNCQDSCSIFVLNSKAFSGNFNFYTADAIVVLDSCFNYQQARNRAVLVLRLVTKNSVEDRTHADKYKSHSKLRSQRAEVFNNLSHSGDVCDIFRKYFSEDESALTSDRSLIGDDEKINEMISRNEDEKKTLREMDSKRERKDAENELKSRLIEAEELPLWMLRIFQQEESKENTQEIPHLRRSTRIRKTINYDESKCVKKIDQSDEAEERSTEGGNKDSMQCNTEKAFANNTKVKSKRRNSHSMVTKQVSCKHVKTEVEITDQDEQPKNNSSNSDLPSSMYEPASRKMKIEAIQSNKIVFKVKTSGSEKDKTKLQDVVNHNEEDCQISLSKKPKKYKLVPTVGNLGIMLKGLRSPEVQIIAEIKGENSDPHEKKRKKKPILCSRKRKRKAIPSAVRIKNETSHQENMNEITEMASVIKVSDSDVENDSQEEQTTGLWFGKVKEEPNDSS